MWNICHNSYIINRLPSHMLFPHVGTNMVPKMQWLFQILCLLHRYFASPNLESEKYIHTIERKHYSKFCKHDELYCLSMCFCLCFWSLLNIHTIKFLTDTISPSSWHSLILTVVSLHVLSAPIAMPKYCLSLT